MATASSLTQLRHRRSQVRRSICSVAAIPNIDIFCRAVEARSREHREAMDVAITRGWWAIAGSVLRMELDSMIRVVYLLRRPDLCCAKTRRSP